MSAIVLFCLLLSMAFSRFGIAIAAMMPMIAKTISSSMRVNPDCLLIFMTSSGPFLATRSRPLEVGSFSRIGPGRMLVHDLMASLPSESGAAVPTIFITCLGLDALRVLDELPLHEGDLAVEVVRLDLLERRRRRAVLAGRRARVASAD